jgi:hypothetical protein
MTSSASLALLSVLSLASGSLEAQSSAPVPARVATTIYVGTGEFATPLDPFDGSTSVHVPLLGASLEFGGGRRLRFGVSAGAGALPGGSAGGSTSSGLYGEAAAVWLLTPEPRRWGVSVGPSVAYTRFGVGRTGFGGAISAGARRGIGPRLTVRTHAMSGQGSHVTTRVELGLVLSR